MTRQSTPGDRPRYRISADRQSAYRRVRYVESSHPGGGECTLCQLDELAEREQIEHKLCLPETHRQAANPVPAA